MADRPAKPRKPKRAVERARRRRARVEEAATATAALDAAFDLLRASLKRREGKNPTQADEMRRRIANQMIDTAERLDRIKE